MQRLLHEPTAQLKGLPAEGGHGRLQVARELFGLEGGGDQGGPRVHDDADAGAVGDAPAGEHELPRSSRRLHRP
jgi:hypothetical protein